jgi:hypothetical protein
MQRRQKRCKLLVMAMVVSDNIKGHDFASLVRCAINQIDEVSTGMKSSNIVGKRFYFSLPVAEPLAYQKFGASLLRISPGTELDVNFLAGQHDEWINAKVHVLLI